MIRWFVRNLSDGVDGGDKRVDRLHGVGAEVAPLLSARATRSDLASLRRRTLPSAVRPRRSRSPPGRPLGGPTLPERARRPPPVVGFRPDLGREPDFRRRGRVRATADEDFDGGGTERGGRRSRTAGHHVRPRRPAGQFGVRVGGGSPLRRRRRDCPPWCLEGRRRAPAGRDGTSRRDRKKAGGDGGDGDAAGDATVEEGRRRRGQPGGRRLAQGRGVRRPMSVLDLPRRNDHLHRHNDGSCAVLRPVTSPAISGSRLADKKEMSSPNQRLSVCL